MLASNAEQGKTNRYSYTLYDALGRITQVGQLVQSTAMTQLISRDAEALATWLNQPKEQLTVTVYDISDPTKQSEFPAGFQQHNLRSRVSYTYVKETGSGPVTHASFYSYDIHGNVHTLLQDYTKIATDFNVERFRQINYEYDLISGKVNKVAYQPGKTDGFYHRYHYDAENRITQVYTSRDGFYWERDAAYSYYRHGPLQRTVLGQLNVQGIDYAYTLQGWLKGVNSTTLNPDFDMGEDGKTGSPVARDVYSFGLHYYENSTQKDYKPTGTNNPFASAANSSFKSLYNGNIASMSVNLGALKQADGLGVYNDALLYNYRYDQLNRIKEMQAYNGLNISTNTWLPAGINDYKELISYDPNGNILTYFRNGASATGINMDKMKYHYNAGNNQLNYVYDTVPAGNYSVDIDAQSINNYQYDAIGNLIKDNAEGISSITWNVYGKISSISKTSGTISYTYDATGNRISKTVGGITTLYVRDVSGNVMSVYEVPATNTIIQKELHIYGSGRLGMIMGELDIEAVSLPSEFGQGRIVSITRGKKYFELSNHLGNVLAVVSDKRILVTGGVYEADIVSATDYAPFGMGLVGRSYSSEEYRYGFNGKENDNETKTQDYGFRIYNPGLGKFLSVDPLHASYPWYSPYHFAGNSPILNVDLDGGEPRSYLNDWVWKDMFVLSSKERVGQYMMITDPKLGKQPIEVNVVYDKTTNQHWFIHKDNIGQYYYLKNETGESDVMNIDHNTNTLTKGHFEKFETQDQIQAKLGVELGRGMATSVFGVGAFGSALPAMTVIGGAPLYSINTNLASSLIGSGSDLLSQYAQGSNINYASVLANGIFKNPFISSTAGTLFEFNSEGKGRINSSSEEVLLGGILGGILGGASNRFSLKYSVDPSMKINEKVVTGIGQGIVNFYGNFTAREMQKLLEVSNSDNQIQSSETINNDK